MYVEMSRSRNRAIFNLLWWWEGCLNYVWTWNRRFSGEKLVISCAKKFSKFSRLTEKVVSNPDRHRTRLWLAGAKSDWRGLFLLQLVINSNTKRKTKLTENSLAQKSHFFRDKETRPKNKILRRNPDNPGWKKPFKRPFSGPLKMKKKDNC